MTAEIYLDAVHYQEEDGSWQEMDDSLSEEAAEEDAAPDASGKAPGDFVNKKGRLKIRFKNQAKEQGTVTVSKDGAELTWGMEGVQRSRAQRYGTDGKQILYPGVLPGVDLRCRVIGEKVKEDLVLASPDSPETFAFLYKLKKLRAVQENNRVSFLDEEENEKFTVSAPYMKDAAGETSGAIKVSLSPDKQGRCRVTFQADREWLTAPERKYPVVVDPVTTTSLKLSDIQDTYVSSLYEEDNFCDNYNRIKGGDEVRRSFLRFPLPAISSGDMVINASLALVSIATDGEERTVRVHRVLQDWNHKDTNWYNKPVYEEVVQDLCKFKGDTAKMVRLDVTRLVKDWYQNGNNFGVMIKDDYEFNRETIFLSSNDVLDEDQMLRPKIEITYVNYSGLEDYWTYHSQSVGRAGTVHVNDYNGNLILVRPTLVLGGSRMPVSLNHVFNSNDRDVNIGYGSGFRLNYHQTIKKVTISGTDYYRHTDGDGTVHYFYYDSKKKAWKDESGLEFTLTVNSGAAEAFVIRDKEDNELVFSSSGYLVKVRDKNDNTLAITYGSGRITKITDGAGRVTTLTYLKDSAGKATNLSQVKTPSGQTITFAYTANGTMTDLTSVTDIDGAKVTYTFDSKGNLASAANVDGYQVKYAYYSTAPYRVKTITEYGGSTVGNSLALVYGYNSTKFTDNKGRTEICRFNNSGNLIHIHDGFGHAASGKYNTGGNHVNRLENETKLQSNIVQLLKDPVIQAKTIGWFGKVGKEGAGSATVNTDTAYCKVGTRSLKAVCTDQSTFAYWGQDVTLQKGQTYTVSMYVRAQVTAAAADGGCMLRARYLDKDGAQHLLDSEILKASTRDFVRLKRTFTLPADAGSATVRIYVGVWRAEGTIYGDMAQLETGDTANRVNLVDNGEFHRGSTSGFSKTGRGEDGLTSVGESSRVPTQFAALATAAGTMYSTPSASGTAVAAVTKGQRLATDCACIDSAGTAWYRVRNASGQWGYLTGGFIPYLGGSDCLNTAAVGVTGANLRAAPSDTGTPVEEWIPKGTSLALVSSKTDANHKKWYYLGMQIDKTRYAGYLPADQVIRFCRNRASVKMQAADS